MIFDEFSPRGPAARLTAGGRTLRALGLDGPLTGVLALIVCIGDPRGLQRLRART